MICTASLIFASCSVNNANLSSKPSSDSSDSTNSSTQNDVNSDKEGGAEDTTSSTIESNQKWNNIYATVLQGYRDAIKSGFQDYPELNFNDPNIDLNSDALVTPWFRWLYSVPYRFIYYAYKDLDGNGTPELLIKLDGAGFSFVTDIWTATNAKPMRVFGSPMDGNITVYSKGIFQWAPYSFEKPIWFLSIGPNGGAVVNAVGLRAPDGNPGVLYKPLPPCPLWTDILSLTPEKAYEDISIAQNQVSISQLNIDSSDANIQWVPLFNQSDNKDRVTSEDGIMQPDIKTSDIDYMGIVPQAGFSLYKGPGTSYDIITVIPQNVNIVEIGYNWDDYEWSFVRFDSYEGWVVNEFIKYTGGGVN